MGGQMQLCFSHFSNRSCVNTWNRGAISCQVRHCTEWCQSLSSERIVRGREVDICAFLAYYWKSFERNWNPSIGLSELWIVSSFTPVAFLWYFPPICSDFPAWLNFLVCSYRQYVLLVPSVVRSNAPQTACVQLHNLSEPLSVSAVLEYGSVQKTLFEEPMTQNDFFKCSEFKVFPLLKLLKRV